VVLLGEPAYYARFGFAPARNYGVTPQVAEWEPAFQLRPLTAWDPALRGEYRYAPAFDRL
jgi:putative acetyltransferase